MVSGDADGIEQVAQLLHNARSVCCLTGAGISAESGVPTFRGSGGFWEGRRAEDLATPEGFAGDPVGVWAFYNYRRNLLLDCQPNPGHRALVDLAGYFERLAIVTQNIDGLHQAAGSSDVIELHGSIWTIRCTTCAHQELDARRPAGNEPRCPQCQAWLRPGVVWFGEMLPREALEQADEALSHCDVVLVIGTSAVVQPAASLAFVAQSAGATVVEVNLEATPLSGAVDHVLTGPSGEILPALVTALAPLR